LSGVSLFKKWRKRGNNQGINRLGLRRDVLKRKREKEEKF
jgi:hypothetical protein